MESRVDEPVETPELLEVLRIRGEEEFGQVPPAVSEPPRRRVLPAIAALLAAAALIAVVPRLIPATHLKPSRTVPAGKLPYGPDAWPQGMVDPSFAPAGALPRGLAVTATVGNVLWGAGDRKATGAQPLDGKAAELVEDRLRELVAYARSEVKSRNLPNYPSNVVDPKLTTNLPALTVNLSLDWRNGTTGTAVRVPLATDPKAEAETRRIVHNAAKTLTDSTADGIEWMRKNDPNLP